MDNFLSVYEDLYPEYALEELEVSNILRAEWFLSRLIRTSVGNVDKTPDHSFRTLTVVEVQWELVDFIKTVEMFTCHK